MATLTPTQITRTGIADTLTAAAAGGDVFTNTSREWLEINNGGGSSITLYAAFVADGTTIVQGKSWTIANGTRQKIGPFPTSPYNDSSNRVSLTYSGVTTVTVGVFYV